MFVLVLNGEGVISMVVSFVVFVVWCFEKLVWLFDFDFK